MRVLIAGGAGFVGSMLNPGHHVHVVDDPSTGSIDNISHLKTHEHFGSGCSRRSRSGQDPQPGRLRSRVQLDEIIGRVVEDFRTR